MTRFLAVLALALAAASHGCQRTLPAARSVEDPTGLEGVLGVHLVDGGLLVLEQWETAGDPPDHLVGPGVRYDARRTLVAVDTFRMPYDSIVMLETAVPEPLDLMVGGGLGATGIAAFTVLTGALTLACLVDPKSCFGSCPTFYANPSDDRPVAEGFSGSIARALEARDIDALPGIAPRDGAVRLAMRNEALETHAVRSVRLLAVPAGPAGVAATSAGVFRQVEELRPPVACRAPEGDCLAVVAARDGRERRSWTDGRNLAAREVVELELPAPEGPAGILLSARHTFVSTFVFYQMMAYMGRDAGDVLAAIERGDDPGLLRAFERGVGLLGDLEVLIHRGGSWRTVARISEAGPLAADEHLILLPSGGDAGETLRVRLVMARGYWRLESAALARLGPEVRPAVLEPARVLRAGVMDAEARRALMDSGRHLVTYPGDSYTLEFDTGPGAGKRYFLESTGYYYEWMRAEWLEDRSPAMMALFRIWPRLLFRRLAPAFKAREARMEELFWASRFGRAG